MYQVILVLSTLLYGRLTADLAAADYRVRERATKALATASWPAYPAIAAAAHSPDAERRQRAEELLRKFEPSEHIRDCVGVLEVLGRRGSPFPTEAEYDWLWAEGRRAELFKKLCLTLGLYRPDKPDEFSPSSIFWWGSTGRGEWIAVMRMRAAGTPMAWPTDPFGPKEVIPNPKEVRGGKDEEDGEVHDGQGGRDGDGH